MNNQLTRKDIENMEKEIEHRVLVLRKELLEDVKTARALGDLSENFEYYAAKKAKNENESRIRYLERMIKTATIIEDNSAADEVAVDKSVTLRMENTKQEMTYVLVTDIRGDSLNGMITLESPLAKALIGHKTGECVNVRVSPSVQYDVTILKVEPIQ